MHSLLETGKDFPPACPNFALRNWNSIYGFIELESRYVPILILE
jgi:hypothetical protein